MGGSSQVIEEHKLYLLPLQLFANAYLIKFKQKHELFVYDRRSIMSAAEQHIIN